MRRGLTVCIKTYGCQMNEHDSEALAGLLALNGYKVVEGAEEADVFILNTCSVREHAEERVRGRIHGLAARKGRDGKPLVVLCGCMAQSHGGRLLVEMPGLDVVCGTHRLAALPSMIKGALRTRARQVDVSNPEDASTFTSSSPRLRGSALKAWVSIMRGCDNFCSYCIVPYVRGGEVSRPPGDILREVEGLAGRGYREITLLGQNVNSYRGGNEGGRRPCDFVGLLELVAAVGGIDRIRFVTSHPKDVSAELPRAIARLGKVCEHIHLPVQSGSDTVLARMNRKYTRERYGDIVRTLRREVPGIAVTTDLIVGFPGETEEEFGETVRLLEEVRFDGAFIFKYSTRPRTAASGMEDSVPLGIKKERLGALLALQAAISREKNRSLIGSVAEVLADGRSPKDPSRLIGRTRGNRTAVFPVMGEDVGKIVLLRVRDANATTLYCEKTEGDDG